MMRLSNQTHRNGGFSYMPAFWEHQAVGHAWYFRESPTLPTPRPATRWLLCKYLLTEWGHSEKNLWRELKLRAWQWLRFRMLPFKALEGSLGTNGIYLFINSSRIYWKLLMSFQISLSQMILSILCVLFCFWLRETDYLSLSNFLEHEERKRHVYSLYKGSIPDKDSTRKEKSTQPHKISKAKNLNGVLANRIQCYTMTKWGHVRMRTCKNGLTFKNLLA